MNSRNVINYFQATNLLFTTPKHKSSLSKVLNATAAENTTVLTPHHSSYCLSCLCCYFCTQTSGSEVQTHYLFQYCDFRNFFNLV